MAGFLGSLVVGGKGGGGASDLLSRAARGKWLAGGASLLTIGAVLWPVVENWREEPEDGFPLSYYPMFTAKRSERVWITHLVGSDARGERRPIPYAYAGTGGLNQVRRQINRIVREGNAEALCRTVAARIALEEDARFADVVEVRIVTGRYLLADFYAGAKDPISERVRASCRVERGVA